MQPKQRCIFMLVKYILSTIEQVRNIRSPPRTIAENEHSHPRPLWHSYYTPTTTPNIIRIMKNLPHPLVAQSEAFLKIVKGHYDIMHASSTLRLCNYMQS